jgi:hypothetical protein
MFMPRELSSSKLLNGGSYLVNDLGNGGGAASATSNSSSSTSAANNSSVSPPDFEELIVTIRKSERGFGFDLKNGILVQNVFPSTTHTHTRNTTVYSS